MKKTLGILTLTIVVIAGAAMVFAGVTAQKTNATSSLCHSTTLSIKAPASVVHGKTITVTGGAEGRTPQHTVKATLQSRKATSSKWINGASANLSSGSYSLKWKAPATKGKYQVRVRVTHSGTSKTSVAKPVTVK